MFNRCCALAALCLVLAFGARADAPAAWIKEIKTYDRAAHSRGVTDCDRLAAHPDDPEKVQPGLERPQIDFTNAIPACQAAVKADPQNPRLNYQLARLFSYAGRGEEGKTYRERALMAGYPQSLFVFGWIRVTGWEGQPKEVCTGAELIRKSAQAGRLAGLVGFPHYVVNGYFDACPVAKDKAEMLGFLTRAKADARDFYKSSLVENLEARVKALP
jgi:hypothetical protein